MSTSLCWILFKKCTNVRVIDTVWVDNNTGNVRGQKWQCKLMVIMHPYLSKGKNNDYCLVYFYLYISCSSHMSHSNTNHDIVLVTLLFVSVYYIWLMVHIPSWGSVGVFEFHVCTHCMYVTAMVFNCVQVHKLEVTVVHVYMCSTISLWTVSMSSFLCSFFHSLLIHF